MKTGLPTTLFAVPLTCNPNHYFFYHLVYLLIYCSPIFAIIIYSCMIALFLQLLSSRCHVNYAYTCGNNYSYYYSYPAEWTEPPCSPAALSAVIQTDRQCMIQQTEQRTVSQFKTTGGCCPFCKDVYSLTHSQPICIFSNLSVTKQNEVSQSFDYAGDCD